MQVEFFCRIGVETHAISLHLTRNSRKAVQQRIAQ
jgi:hypothetical protein